MYRNRKDFTKVKKLIPGIYFDERPILGITYIKTIPLDYPGVRKKYYTINTEGEVYSLSGVKLSQIVINSGYYTYHLLSDTPDKKYKIVTAHRLVLYSFCPISNPESYTVNHINMNPADNRLCNLEWVLQAENNKLKYDVIPNDGTNNYHAAFSKQQLVSIVNKLDAGMKYKDILISIGMEPTDNNCDYIGNIKRGKTYVNEINEIKSEKFNDYVV